MLGNSLEEQEYMSMIRERSLLHTLLVICNSDDLNNYDKVGIIKDLILDRENERTRESNTESNQQ